MVFYDFIYITKNAIAPNFRRIDFNPSLWFLFFSFYFFLVLVPLLVHERSPLMRASRRTLPPPTSPGDEPGVLAESATDVDVDLAKPRRRAGSSSPVYESR